MKPHVKEMLRHMQLEAASLQSQVDQLTDATSDKDIKRRAALLRQLLDSHRTRVEMEEMERISAIGIQAVEKDWIDTPKDLDSWHVGDCVLCHVTIGHPLGDNRHCHRFYCCQGVVCHACFEKISISKQKAHQKVQAAEDQGDPIRFKAGWATVQAHQTCPACGQTSPPRHQSLQLKEHAVMGGMAWAQYEVALQMLPGATTVTKDFPSNRTLAATWFAKASQQGHARASYQLSLLWRVGFPEQGRPASMKQSNDYQLAAARQGHAASQSHQVLQHEEDSDEAVMWHTLAAAQGIATDEAYLSAACYHGNVPGIRQCYFAALYWSQRAVRSLTIDSSPEVVLAADILSRSLLATRRATSGGVDWVGCSALPEALFWHDVHVRLARADPHRPDCLASILSKCGGCGTTSNATIRKCARCHAIGYCGRDCQTKHWKLGHKVDCTGLDTVKRSLCDPRLWDRTA